MDVTFNKAEVENAVREAFSPHSPVNQSSLFRGRAEQIRMTVDAAKARGLHVVIYGERGVGKTSLANMIRDAMGEVQTSRVNCSEFDTFTTVLRRSLATIMVPKPGEDPPGFERAASAERTSSIDLPKGEFSPDFVASLVADLAQPIVLIIDEFDRLKPSETMAFADFLKSLSDRGSPSTVVLVGVAEDINALIKEHASVERCLRQVRLQRMSNAELTEIVQGGLQAAGLTLDSDLVLAYILHVSQGFPHYTHLLAQNGARAAIEAGRLSVTPVDVIQGMGRAVQEADQSHRDLYHRAVTGGKKRNLWKDVAMACAIAPSDERGYFSSPDVQERLATLLNHPIKPQTLSYHLRKMTEPGRGPLLERIGPERRYRFRFLKPFMRPFIAMTAINEGHLRIGSGSTPRDPGETGGPGA
jgi:Cdc6-like AAA superfamily ATPase